MVGSGSSIKTTGTRKEKQRRKKTRPLQFLLLSSMSSEVSSPGPW